MSETVLTAGGGAAALEAAVALRRRAGERVSPTLLAPEAHLAQIARDQNRVWGGTEPNLALSRG